MSNAAIAFVRVDSIPADPEKTPYDLKLIGRDGSSVDCSVMWRDLPKFGSFLGFGEEEELAQQLASIDVSIGMYILSVLADQ